MHRLPSWFLVVLLALRGLLGDAMAMELMQPIPVPVPITHTVQHTHTADTHCLTAAEAPQHHATDCHTTSPDGSHCSSCVVCHSVGTLHNARLSLPLASPMAAPRYTPTAQISAPLSHLIKPPIV